MIENVLCVVVYRFKRCYGELFCFEVLYIFEKGGNEVDELFELL